jgi:hypothetical protein
MCTCNKIKNNRDTLEVKGHIRLSQKIKENKRKDEVKIKKYIKTM